MAEPAAAPAEPPAPTIITEARPGFALIIVTINLNTKQKFGMMVKASNGNVFVRNVTAGSMCDGVVKELDQVITVNGKPVSECDKTRQLIVKEMKEYKTVDLLIHRPETAAAKDKAEALLNKPAAGSLRLPSVSLRSDVKEIQKRFAAKLKSKPAQPKSILSKDNNSNNMKSTMSAPMAPAKSPGGGTSISFRQDPVPGPNPPAPSAPAAAAPGGPPTSAAEGTTPTTPAAPATSPGHSKSPGVKTATAKKRQPKTPSKNVRIQQNLKPELIAADMSCRIPMLQKVPQKLAPQAPLVPVQMPAGRWSSAGPAPSGCAPASTA